MKKLLALILCLALTLSLAACGSNGEGGSTATEGGSNASGEQSNTENSSGSTGQGGTSNQSASAFANFKAIMPDKTFIDVNGKESDPTKHIVKAEGSNLTWRYVTLNANKKGETVNILHVSDFHIVNTNAEDLKNPVTVSVFENHSGSKNGMGKTQYDDMLKYPALFDFTVSTGDNVDYMHLGALELFKQTIFKLNNAFVALGNHDISRVNNGLVSDTTTLESRYDVLKQYWPHDLDYSSKVVKDTVMIIQLDNAQSKYYGEQATKLEADIKKAKSENLTVLIFQHMPISVNDFNQSRINPIDGGETQNFQKSYIGGSKYQADDVTKKVYELITQNADVVKGVFCGHEHEDFYTEIHGSYLENGNKVEAIIPQYVLDALHQESGIALAITVK